VTRLLGLPALLVALAVGGFLYATQAKSDGPTSSVVQQATVQAQASVSTTNFQGADTSMQAFYAQSGTYAGATLPPGSGVVLVRADATSYCLQAGDEHENGPGGQVQPGGC
jgi:hypothetical protein